MRIDFIRMVRQGHILVDKIALNIVLEIMEDVYLS